MAETAVAAPGRCANCDEVVTAQYCAHCGQAARELRLPFTSLLWDALDHVFSVDARLLRTLRPLVFRPGTVARDYLGGRRVTYLPPLRAYLIAALIFFGLFTIFPSRAPVLVYTTDSSAAAAARTTSARGGRVTVELPEHVAFNDAWYQEVVARAKANPEAFARAIYHNVPRAFFLFLPIFAAMLELFYRKGYYIEHLVFSLYYYAFVFTDFALLFLLGKADAWLPPIVVRPLRWTLLMWLLAYLPIALRCVYGGSWPKTGMKVVGLGVLYALVFVPLGFALITFMAVITF